MTRGRCQLSGDKDAHVNRFFPEKNDTEANDETVFLLGTCYYRAGHKSQCYSVLKGQASPDCRYLFARVCLDLDK